MTEAPLTRPGSTLYWRLTGLIALVLAASGVILALGARDYARTAADDAYDRLLLSAARQISETVRAEAGTATADVPPSALETLSLSGTARIYYKVEGPNGAFVTGYEGLEAPGAGTGHEPQVADGWFRGVPVRMATQARFLSDPDVRGWVVTTVAQTREARDGLAAELLKQALILIAVMSAAALAGVMLAVRWALAPLARIEAALAGREPNDLAPLDVVAPAEIGALVATINRFMARFSGRLAAMETMIADAAHQIRTPLTGLIAQLELLAGETRPERREAQVGRARERAGELGRLTNQLLSRAMVMHRAEAVRFESLDLAVVARQALAEAVPASLGRDLAVAFDAPAAGLMVQGDRLSLAEALKNLIGNAVHHGAPTRLTVRVRRAETEALVEVVDDGPGIPAADWERVTERFTRGTGGRRGSGLGLAIAAEVARSHGGRIGFGHGPDGFVVSFAVPAGERP